MKKFFQVIGLMSGTSVDSLDIALAGISYDKKASVQKPPALLRYDEVSFPPSLREILLHVSGHADEKCFSVNELSALDTALGNFYADAVLSFLEKFQLSCEDIDLIASHGQTISHCPQREHAGSTDINNISSTWQIGDGDSIAKRTGITTVSDFRRSDIALGGEGAPFAPALHQVLFGAIAPVTVVLNLGGIANITVLKQEGNSSHILCAYDTGPANMLMDALAVTCSGGGISCDINGEKASEGEVCTSLLRELLAHPYFSRVYPKSCGRSEFGETVLQQVLRYQKEKGCSDDDLLRTACELTVQSVRKGVRDVLSEEALQACKVIVTGGGVRNTFLMECLKEELAPASVESSSHYGIAPESVEALCFAWLGFSCVAGIPFCAASATGALSEGIYGKISPGKLKAG